MIVPRTRLIVLTALVLIPVTSMTAFKASMDFAAWLVSGMLVVFAFADAIKGRRRFDAIDMVIPKIIRMTVDRTSTITVTIHTSRQFSATMRVGLALPAAIVADEKILMIRVKPEHDTYLATWLCSAVQRGRYILKGCYGEIPSPWGLWSMRRRYGLECEIRAYPNLVNVRENTGGLFRTRDWGLQTQRCVGKGREFEQLREYTPGDSYEDIDWKATARRRYPITRVFQIEQAQEVYVIVDGSRLSTRSVAYVRNHRVKERPGENRSQTTIFERFITAALVMAVAADQAADRYGLLLFSNKPDCFIKAGRGKAHYSACRDALYNRMPNSASPDFDELFTFIGSRLRKRSLLFFLTSLDDPVLMESFIQTMPVAAKKHVMMVNMLRPPGAHPLFSFDTIKEVEGIYRHLVGHMVWNTLLDTKRLLSQHGTGFYLLDKEILCGQLIRQYMAVKQRQIL